MKKIIIPIIAFTLLSISLISMIFEKNKKEKNIIIDKKQIMINESNYIFPDKFKNINYKTIGDSNGIPLDKVILKSKINNPENLKYTIIASDNYQKTVSWEDLGKGIITNEKNVIFEHLPKGFWIKDVIKIEVSK